MWVLAVLAVVGAAVLVHRISDVIRGRPVRAVVEADAGEHPPSVSDPRFLEVVQALTGTHLEPGNRVEILTDTAVFQAMLRDIATARRSVTVQDYYCEPGRLGDRLADALVERARSRVRVLVMGDGFSCGRYLRKVGPRLRAAGARVAVLRPVHWYALHRAQHRSHVRSVVVDGRIAYTGGFGFADEWIGESPETPPWRDTSVRFTGPAVRRTEAAFLAAWAEATGELRAGAGFLPPDSRTGTSAPKTGTVSPAVGATSPQAGSPDGAETDSVRAGLLVSEPGLGTTAAERYLALTVAGAEHTLHITNSYFVPPPVLVELLEAAARRGVDVRLLLPGPRTDMPSTRYAGQAFYESLLGAGVRIWEYRPAMIHAKTLIADGVWGSVGGINLDNRSLRLNSETALLFHDRGVGAVLDSLFRGDLARADEITLERHRERSTWDRIREKVVRLVAPLL
ncbi:MAG: phospholipase D-like domain-containing protein [Candidatus Palauibacterales bacterium]|nr:phospholipase D-like domain-containing protein [Candidatus Palauibacterales bacterium]